MGDQLRDRARLNLYILSSCVAFSLLMLNILSFSQIHAGNDDYPIGEGFINASGGLPVGTSQHSIWFGDINNDSFLDVATAGYSGVRVWTGDGNGNWALASNGLPSNSYDGGICMGDINNDGFMDVAAANYDFGVGSVGVWTSDGTGSWTPASSGLPSGGWYTGLYLADINNDGNLDLAVGNENTGVRVYAGTGTGMWTEVSTNLPTSGAYYSVWMGDVNHDNYTDLVAAGPGLHVWLGDGTGIWTEASNGLPWTDMWSGVTLGDINLDGHLDIVASMDMSGHGLRAWIGDGTSNWTEASAGLPTTGLYYGVVLADLVGDKYPDILAAGYQGTTAVEIWIGNGGNSWTKYPGSLPTGKIIGVAAGDINNDGYLDIGVAGESFGVQVWKNDAVVPPLKVEVIVPNGGETWVAGSQQQISWVASGGSPPLSIRIEYSTNGLIGDYSLISDSEANDGIYLWDIPNTPSIDCYVRINVTDSSMMKNWDKSDQAFTILPAESDPPSIFNIQPANGTIIGNNKPIISASYADPSGIDIDSITIEVDFVNVTSSSGITATEITYVPPTPLTEGVHNIYLEVSDKSINHNKAALSWWFVVDSQPPTILEKQPQNGTTIVDSTPAILVEYTDNSGVDIASVRLTVDTIDVTSSSAITETSALYLPSTPLSDGMHNLSIRVNDTSNPANQAYQTWWFILDTSIVDLSPPNITGLTPQNGSVTEDIFPVVEASYDDLSGVNISSVYLELDLVDVTSSSIVTPIGISYAPTLPMSQGIHSVFLTLEDDSPNRNRAEALWWFEINSLAPNITDIQPSNGSLINDNTPTISATYSDDSGIDVDSVRIRVDTADVTPLSIVTATSISYTPTHMDEGVHEVFLEVSDNSSLKKTARLVWWFVIDTNVPRVTNITPENGSTLGYQNPAIGADFYDESGMDDFATLYEFVNSDDGRPVPGSVMILPRGITFTPDIPLPDGNYCAHLEVSDLAGNRAIADWCFSVDTTPPTIVNLNPANQSVVTLANPTISATYHDITGVNLTKVILTLDSFDVTGSAIVTESGITFTLVSGLQDGVHTASLYLEDLALPPNNISIEWSFTVSTQREDTDLDGLPDEWEFEYFGGLNETPENDSDYDGLTNQQEYDLGTDPTASDTDGDGIPDGQDSHPLISEAIVETDLLGLAVIIASVILILLALVFFLKRKKKSESEEGLLEAEDENE